MNTIGITSNPVSAYVPSKFPTGLMAGLGISYMAAETRFKLDPSVLNIKQNRGEGPLIVLRPAIPTQAIQDKDMDTGIQNVGGLTVVGWVP